MGIRLAWRERRITRLSAAAGLTLVLLVIAGCSASSGSGGTNISLGLAGSTADHPSAPPTVSASGPSTDTYAFVYDDQIWIHNGSSSQSGNCNPCQLTHLVLSNGADIAWGPLVWSQSGTYIAFSLVQNLTPTVPDRSAGPIYVVNTTNGDTVVTPGIGSIYGHTYTWYGDNMLFYSSGDGISMYDIHDPDPRVWQVLSSMSLFNVSPTTGAQTFTSNNFVYGDIAITTNDSTLTYSEANITNIGGTGKVGTAQLYQVGLPALSAYNIVYSQNANSSPVSIAIWLSQQFPLQGSGNQIADLGAAYSDTEGNYTMGSWQVEANDHHVVWQNIQGVNTSAETISSTFCYASPSAGYCAEKVLSGAGNYSQSLHGQLGLSPKGNVVAFAGAQLYQQASNGGNVSQLASSGWILTPVTTHSGSLVVATQLVSSSRDSNGVLRTNTNLVAFDGQNHYVLIAGAEDPSWK